MGKKGKKTRWRELPITLADKPYAAAEPQQSSRHAADPKPVNFAAAAGRRSHGHHGQTTQHQQYHQHRSPSRGNQSAGSGQQQQHQQQQHHHHHHQNVESSTVTFNEDEYTKITTPRQDVLFKKGYLGRRKHTSVPVITEALNENEDGVSTDTIINPLDELCPHGEYVDPSAMYILNGGGYEIYDPYTGNVTMLMGGPPPGHYPPVGHPMMAAMPYPPMSLQAVDWYNPSNPSINEHWMPGAAVHHSNTRNHKKPTADVQQNCSAQNSDANSSGQESGPVDQQSLYQTPQPYNMYPGYMLGTPMYNYNGVNIQVPQPQSPPSPSISYDYTNGKRRKKKKRRKRGVTDEYSDSSSEEQKSQSGASCDLVLDSEKTSDSGVLTNNSGGSTPVNVIPVQLSHTAAPFHMECPQPFEILHSAPILVHHHHLPAADHHQMAAYYQPIPQYATEQLAPIGYQVIPEEQAADVVGDDDDDDDDHQLQNSEPTASYSAENSDSGISSPNSEVMVKGGSSKGTDDKNEKPKSGDAGNVAVISGTGSVESTSAMTTTTTTATTTTSKKSRNKKNKGRDKGSDSTKVTAKQGNKTATVNQQKSDHHVHHEVASVGSKKSSKIAKEPAIIKKLNAKKAKSGGKPETDKPETCKSPPPPPPQLPVRSVDDDDDDGDDDERSAADPVSADDGGMSEEIIQLSIGPVDAEWMQEEVFCSLECTPRSTTTDHVQFQFAKTHSVDSCESVEEETFATAVNTGNSDTENETVLRQDEPTKLQQDPLSRSVSRESDAADTSVPPSTVAAPGPITEAVTKWLNDQGGLMLAPCLDDSSCTDEGELSEYDDFEEHSTVAVANASPKNVQGNPYPALSRSEAGSRVAGASPHDQRQAGGLVSSGICCLTQ